MNTNKYFTIVFMAIVITACRGSGGGGDAPQANPNDRTADAQALDAAPLTSGRSIRIKSVDSDVDGASLIIPPGSVDQDATIVISSTSTQPGGSPWGQGPVGSLFEIGPSGLTFDTNNKALLTLPLSPGGVNNNLHIGRWNETTGGWEDLGGAITGDFISTEVDHLSLYGVFTQGKSLVNILNDVAPNEDPSNLGIEIRYISGPLPPPDWPDNEPFPAYRPLPEGGIALKIGESRLMALPPGQYHFAVSFPPPFQIANSMLVRIPVLVTGADDTTTDQSIAITGNGASSDNTLTNTSLADFPGSWTITGSNQPPSLACLATVPVGVAVTNNDPGTNALPSRRIGVGPIIIENLDLNAVELTGIAIDPEASSINHYWTWSQFSTLPTKEVAASGVEVGHFFRPNPKREGRYDVFLTAYDSFNLFDECHWEIIVRGNVKPTIEVIADDYVVDFGRLGSERIGGSSAIDRFNLGAPPSGATSWCNYIDTDLNVELDTTLIKTLPIFPTSESPDHIYRPTQYPPGMTCVYAMVGDADGDPLATNFRFPFGGDLYDALTGAKITTAVQLDAYNALLSSMATSFPMPPILTPFAPEATFALPIIWEAPDNMTSTLPGAGGAAGLATHDCRHIHMDPAFTVDAGPCTDVPGTYPAGGITAIVATVTDGFSREQIDDFGVGYGEDDIVRLDGGNGGGSGGGGSGTNKPPTCSDDSVTTNNGQSVTVTLSGSDPDGDQLTYNIIGQPANGALSGTTYTPNLSYSGADSFTFVANDGQANSPTCTVNITINEVEKFYVFKQSGLGYHKRWGGLADRVSGYEYFYVWSLPSTLNVVTGTGFDNTVACENGPWAGPVLTPSIWETRNIELMGGFDTFEEMEPYRCDVPNWVYSNPICNKWVFETDATYWNNINSICGN